MSLDREPVAAALATVLAARCPQFKNVTRRFRMIEQVDAVEMPIAIVSIGSERHWAPVQRGAPNLWRVQFPVSVYNCADQGSLTVVPSTQQNALVKAVEDALERPVNERPNQPDELYSTTLGLPNVQQVRLVAVDTDEGVATPKAWALLLIEVDLIS